MPNAICPHCQIPSQITYFPMIDGKRDSVIIWLGDSWLPAANPALIDQLGKALAVEHRRERWCVGRCENCREPVFVILDYYDEQKVKSVYPAYRGIPHPDITKKQVGEDYVEAKLCLSVGAFKGAAVLCRRALQGAAIDKGAKKEKLQDQLDELADARILQPGLVDVAHNIRMLSNYGAHPGKDGLDDVTEDEAKGLCDLTWQILEQLYVVPAASARIAAAVQAKRSQAKKVAPAKSSKS